MTTSQTVEISTPSIDWRSIIAGTVAAAALFLVLFGFGSALGLSLTSARTYAGLSATGIAVFSALWFAMVYVVTFAAGGYVAGRLRAPISPSSKEREFRDGAHGFLVWALGTLVGTYMLASTLSGVASKSADVATKAVESAASATSGAAATGAVGEIVSYNVDKLLRAGTTAAPAASVQPALTPRDISEVTRIFGVSLTNGAMTAPDKEYLAQMIAARTGLSPADATRRVDEGYAAVVAKKAEIEAKARDVAETARKAGILAAFLAAALALCGLAASAWAAGCGGRDRDEGRDLVVFGQKRFW